MMCRKPLLSLGLAAALALPLAITAGRIFAADGAAPATEPSAVASPAAASGAAASDAAPTAAVPAGNADLLKQGNDQLNNRQFDDALVTFQLIDLKSLNDTDRATVVDGLTKAKAGAIERREALAEYNRGELSRGANDLSDAQQQYTAALNNPGIDDQTRKLAQARLDEINNSQQAVSTDAVAAYDKGVEDYKKADFAQAKIDFAKAQELGFHGTLTQASPADYLRRLDQNSATADQKTQDTLAQAREAYESGREEFRSGDYDAARKDFALARDKGFTPSFTEGLTPTEYLSRIDELQTAKAQDTSGNKALVTGSSSGTGQTVNLADDTTGSQPAPAPDAQQAQQLDKLASSQNSFQAQGLVDMGAKAEAAGTDADALKYYQQAHDLDPTNAKATDGVNRLSAKLGLTPTNNPTNTLTDRADQIRLEIQAINLKFTQALSDARADISKKQFATARDDIANAQTARDENPSILNPDSLRQMDAQIAATTRDLNNAVHSDQVQRTSQQQAAIAGAERQRIELEKEQRRTAVEALIKLAHTDINQQDYEAALGVLDQIIQLDPQNDYAIGVRSFVEDKAILLSQKNERKRWDYNFSRQITEADENTIPYDDIYRYPDNWPTISELRDNEIENTGVSKEDQAVQAQLDRRLPTITFPQVPFTEAIAFLTEVSGANIQVANGALEAAQIDRQTPVTLAWHDVKLSKVLTEILNQVAPGKLAYAVDDGVINISTIDELNKKTVIKVYDIHDLLINPQFNGQIMGGNLSFSNSGTGGGSGASSQIFSQSQTQQGGTGTGPNGTGSQQLTDIENKIKSTVDFSSWKTNDPNGNGTIDDFNSELIISQTSDVHDDIGNLLAKLREARSIEVTVEVRFLTVNRNFLEDVGLTLNFTSIGLGNNNFAPISLTNQTAQWTQAPTTGVPGTIGDNEPVGMNLSTGYTSGGILDNLQVSLLLRAVQASKTGSIVHAPRVTLTNGQSATLQEQTLIPYVASLTASVAAGAVIAVPVIADATDGVSLNILGAVVSADHKYVTLDLNPVLDQFGGFDTFTFETATSTAGSSGLIAPTAAPTLTIQEPIETVTQVRTRVTVPDGGTLLLGGLTVAGEVEEEAGVPVLSKIPFLQRLSTNKSMAKDENILIMLVKPTIIIDKEIEAKNFPILSANGHQ